MKNYAKLLWSVALVGAVSMSLVSCDNDDDYYYWPYYYEANALVTVKPLGTDSSCLWVDDNTTLFPVNATGALYGGKEVRALLNYREVDGYTAGYKNVFINWIDSIRTKPAVPTLGNLNDETYGSDPIEIVNDWVTIAEDGYLTLRFRTLSARNGTVHYVNLLTGVDSNDPYTVELRHDARGDVSGVYTDGIVAFNLGSLPDTNGETVKLTLKWKGYSADKSVTFDYCTRRSTGSVDGNDVADMRNLLEVK